MRFFSAVLVLLCGIVFGVPAAMAQVVNFDTEIREKGFGKNESRERGVGSWKKGSTRVEIQDRKRYVLVNGSRLYLGHSPSYEHGKFFLKKRDWEKRIEPIVAPPKTKSPRCIVIDPGHGGRDPGKVNKRGMFEKNYVLDISKRVARILKARGYTVLLTREGDSTLELQERPARANRWKADLFVSIHLNSASSSSARGIETFALTPVGEASTGDPGGSAKSAADDGNARDPLNTLLAFKVHSALIAKTDAEDRGVKYANFAVLRTLKCPGVLVECGFLTNASDTALVSTKNGRERIAAGIAAGIEAYVRSVGTAPSPRRK
ncbi:MAG: N-acetylmuramoyl-L-alanine amidase [Opitutales bacterium]|nr:N-acetylmuramoyl-L-alanine amidase [Opitutales bacterium]